MNTDEKSKSSEPEWLKDVKSETVCQWFYAMFFIAAIFGAIAVLLHSYSYIRLYPKLPIAPLLTSIVTLTIGAVNALFVYVICSRSLLK